MKPDSSRKWLVPLRGPPRKTMMEGRTPTDTPSIGNKIHKKAYLRRPTKLSEASGHKGAPDGPRRPSEQTEGAEGRMEDLKGLPH
jgi:hypothetical protein